MKEAWEKRTQTPLLILAVAFGVAYAVPIVAPDASAWIHELCLAVEWVVWGAFALDYAVRLAVTPRKWHFVRHHPLDLLAVLLPMVQPLRLLRLVSTLLLVGRRARMAPQITLTTYVAGAVVGLMMFGSLAVLQVERSAPDGNIRTLGDAVWWSFTTMTTVGYGDHAPTTGLGRVLAVGLMLSGIALLGVVTANIAAWFISRFERDDAVERRHTELLEALTTEVRELRAEVSRLSAPAPVPAPVPPQGESRGIPQTPAVSEAPATPETPDAPQSPAVPETAAAPQSPAVPETAAAPQSPAVPETAAAPETSTAPPFPKAREFPEVPSAPRS